MLAASFRVIDINRTMVKIKKAAKSDISITPCGIYKPLKLSMPIWARFE
jgi:hypothetical protein